MRSGGVVKFSKSINNEQSLTACGRAPFTQGSLCFVRSPGTETPWYEENDGIWELSIN